MVVEVGAVTALARVAPVVLETRLAYLRLKEIMAETEVLALTFIIVAEAAALLLLVVLLLTIVLPAAVETVVQAQHLAFLDHLLLTRVAVVVAHTTELAEQAVLAVAVMAAQDRRQQMERLEPQIPEAVAVVDHRQAQIILEKQAVPAS